MLNSRIKKAERKEEDGMKIIILGAGGILGQTMRLCVPSDVQPVWVRRAAWPREGGDWWYYGLDLTMGVINQKPKIELAYIKMADLADKLQKATTKAESEDIALAIQQTRDYIQNLMDTDGKDPRAMFFEAMAPDVIVNLAGENRPDVVERNPRRYLPINVEVPTWLSWWCNAHNVHYVHVSTQAVFGGEPPKSIPNPGPEWYPPYGADSPRVPVNAYGMQKLQAEVEVSAAGKTWSIVRPTFVLGVRPFPQMGRQNPMEYWLSAGAPVAESQTVAKLREVDDRIFSPSFASDVAEQIWEVAKGQPTRGPINLGIPCEATRYQLAQMVRTDLEVEPLQSSSFPDIAPRARNTSFRNSRYHAELRPMLDVSEREYNDRERLGIYQRAKELAIFLGEPYDVAWCHLARGFGALHNAVAEDWRKANPQADAEILEWYRTTEAYLWELSAYHVDPGFNYSGMCQGIIERLKSLGVQEAMCLGDGIGDLTIALGKAGLHGIYHDLKGSVTARFAEFRQQMYLQSCDMGCTEGWEPLLPVDSGSMQSILSLDFLEHVTDVEAWIRAIYDRLQPGGWFLGQNAFGLGSGPNGSIPCHLERNDRYEKDYGPLMIAVGFQQYETTNWWQKPK